MCGLSGAAGTLCTKAEEVTSDLLYYNYLRGVDSTGVAFIARDPKIALTLIKDTVDPISLMDMKKYEAGRRKISKVILQHNRAATIGPRNRTYAHPFELSNIVGAHNGTVSLNYTKEIPGCKEFDSDSYAILTGIDTIGLEETLKTLYGAWALTWYDKRDNSINFIRNSDRPLYYSMNAEKTQLFWSSEVEHLASATVRNGIKRDPNAKSFLFTEDNHYKWVIPEVGKAFGDPVRKVVKGKQWNYKNYNTKNSTEEWETWEQYANDGKKGDNKNEQRPFPLTALHSNQSSQQNTGTTTSTSANEDQGAKKFVPSLVAKKIQDLGKGKYKLIYMDRWARIYHNSTSDTLDRYYWNPKETKFYYKEWTPPNECPPELIGIDWKQNLKDNRGVILDRPFVMSVERPSLEAPILADETFYLKSSNFYITKARTKKDTRVKCPWIIHEWDPNKNSWGMRFAQNTPPQLPDRLYDICSRGSLFKWRGKKGKRQVFYKAGKNWEVDRVTFNAFTQCGCFSCSRTPTWQEGRVGGVKVHFFSKRGDFLCEYCGDDEDTLEYLKRNSVLGLSNTEPAVIDREVSPAIN